MRTLTLGLALLLASATAAQDPPSKDETRTVRRNLKAIGEAFHQFHGIAGGFPTDRADKAGKPLLSWRVLILPELEENELFRQFNLDEAWDGPTNKPLAAKMPAVYAPVRGKPKPGETFYQVFTGPKSLFDGKTLRTMRSITDGAANTGMVFEAATSVPWTKPGDLAFDEAKDLPKLGGVFGGVCHVVLCDGIVKALRTDADATELKRLIMPADGHPVDFKKLTTGK